MICPLSSIELTKCNPCPLFAGEKTFMNDCNPFGKLSSFMAKLDDLANGLQSFMNDNKQGFHEVYKFFTKYVRRIHPDTHWKKAMKMNPYVIWFQLITPSNIAFVISLLKNGMLVWNKKKMLFEAKESRKMKAKPLFTLGEGQKRSFG